MILSNYHTPVLLNEVIDLLQIKKDKFYLDATIGGGGYAKEILKRGGKVLGIDADQNSINYLQDNFKDEIKSGLLKIYHCNFSQIDEVIKESGLKTVSGLIFDLGISTYQLDKSELGFTYLKNQKLDMRFDAGRKNSAWDIINTYSKGELYEIFTKNSEELNSGSIADAIFRARTLNGKINTTFELNNIIKSHVAVNNEHEFKKILSRIYQSLRIETNRELEQLKKALDVSPFYVEKEGRIVFISYHSLEDRYIKNEFKKNNNKIIKILTKRPIVPAFSEIKENSRARSAKLRIAEKI